MDELRLPLIAVQKSGERGFDKGFDNWVLRFPQGLKVATGVRDVNQLLVVGVLTPLRPSPPIVTRAVQIYIDNETS